MAEDPGRSGKTLDGRRPRTGEDPGREKTLKGRRPGTGEYPGQGNTRDRGIPKQGKTQAGEDPDRRRPSQNFAKTKGKRKLFQSENYITKITLV